jgi:hypothetical protein
MVRATMSFAEAAPFLLTLITVRLFVDLVNEDCYLDVNFVHLVEELDQAFGAIDRMGLELIPEHEHPAEHHEWGTRIYLAERVPV